MAPTDYDYENSDLFDPKKKPNINSYKENHGEEPSIESENKRRDSRTSKVNIVIAALTHFPGSTAGELWGHMSEQFKLYGMKDIYDLRRTLSSMKSDRVNLAHSGNPRKCSITGVSMYPWYLTV
jgi:hypothetical protein